MTAPQRERASPGPQVIHKRVTAEIEGDFVVFLIGMRIYKLWKIWNRLPVFLAMPMIRELGGNSAESGFLGARQYIGSPRRPMLVQYWCLFEHLETYARQWRRNPLAGLVSRSTSASDRTVTSSARDLPDPRRQL